MFALPSTTTTAVLASELQAGMIIQDPEYFNSRELKVTQISFNQCGYIKFEGHLKRTHRNWSMSFIRPVTDMVTIKDHKTLKAVES